MTVDGDVDNPFIDVDVIETSDHRQQVVVVDPEHGAGSGTRIRIKVDLIKQPEVSVIKP